MNGAKEKHSDKVIFNATAPASVAKGEQFRLSYTINAQGTNFHLSENIKDFELLFGPSFSSSCKTSVINGKTFSETYFTYTYILKGRYTYLKRQ